MTFHIGAKPGEIAETVLLPGDPYRARWAAQTFLKDAVLVNEVRGMLGYTGTWNGHRVTIHGSGMGMPSLSIYANELIRDMEHAVLGALKMPAPPFMLDGERPPTQAPPPALGQHNEEILGELGYGGDRVEELKRLGAVAEPGKLVAVDSRDR